MTPEPDLPLGGTFREGWHILPIRIYYEDTDFSGVVYHANYLRYLERGRSDCLRLMGVHHADLWAREEPLAFTIRRIDTEFLQPARIDDLLHVHTVYTDVAGARIEAAQTITRGGAEIVRARVYAACINAEGRPRRIPAALLERFAAHPAHDQD